MFFSLDVEWVLAPTLQSVWYSSWNTQNYSILIQMKKMTNMVTHPNSSFPLCCLTWKFEWSSSSKILMIRLICSPSKIILYSMLLNRQVSILYYISYNFLIFFLMIEMFNMFTYPKSFFTLCCLTYKYLYNIS